VAVSLDPVLTTADVSHIRDSGRDPEQVSAQLKVLREARTSVSILRPAAPGDGIRRFEDHDSNALLQLHEEAGVQGRISSFVPASGSGTRLFQSLLHLYRNRETSLERVQELARSGDEQARDALVVLENITRFAFWPELKRRGCRPESLEQILRLLFGEDGIRYHELPKGLIPFHQYDDRVHTAFAEHLAEAAALGTDRNGVCRIHFTIADNHRQHFEDELRREAPAIEQLLGVRLQVDFSTQSSATDTIATDLDGHLRRDASGQITFHAGGHGALLENLNGVAGDIVLIKNIDNIARRELLPEISHLRRRIAGLLLQVERQVHEAIRELRDGRKADEALRVLDHEFGVKPVAALVDDDSRRRYAIQQLNRPIRVCGVVRTTGHAGGRPFWTDTTGRGACLQIIEGAEVALDDPQEKALFYQSGYFNPVDIACSIRDVDGEPFDLRGFAVPERALIAKKTLGGVPSLVYEHPGLWNGGMGLWNTLFVEVPDIAFNPVKSISDLWATGHRP
jgi:hypothetical protein